jgi:hypothetical protein
MRPIGISMMCRARCGEARLNDTRLWHPWLRINCVLRVMLHTRWSTDEWALRRTGRRRRGHACPRTRLPSRSRHRNRRLLHARTSVRLLMRIGRSPRACQESHSGHIDPRVVSYAKTCRSCHLPPGRPSVDRSDSPRSTPVPDAAASVRWVSRATGSGVTAMESTC